MPLIDCSVEGCLNNMVLTDIWYCEAHRDVTKVQSNTLRIDAGADLVIKPDPHEADVAGLREALETIVSICSTWRAHDGIVKAREIARKALKNFRERERA